MSSLSEKFQTQESDVEVYRCRYCFKSFGQEHFRSRHERNTCISNPLNDQQRTQNLYTCNVCSASYIRKRHLQDHQRDDCGKTHICAKCGRIYSEKSSLRRHMRTVNCIPRFSMAI